MATPASYVCQMAYRNPDASGPLILPVHVLANTPDDELEQNVRANTALDFPWVGVFSEPHHKTAIMCGGGPSLAGFIDDIYFLQAGGGVVFAMNAASQYLRERGITVDWQVIADAKPETASLVDPGANGHLIASQVSPETLARCPQPILWHVASENIRKWMTPERRKTTPYSLLDGAAGVGTYAMSLAYVLGYRKFEVFGYDSSHIGDNTHAYKQPMNQFIPCVDVEWAGRTYRASVGMKMQAEKFQLLGADLQKAGCTVNVHGDGLLPAMWNTKPECLTEKDKYRILWNTSIYRSDSAGEQLVPHIIEHLKPSGLIVDFGCGTGRASMRLKERGYNVLLIDFADNCRDQEAMHLPFIEWDLTRPLNVNAPFGICCDVMEHIPPQDVTLVISNIMGSAGKVFFNISTIEDHCGPLVGSQLHLTVKPHSWWKDLFVSMGHTVEWEHNEQNMASMFVIRSKHARRD